VPGHKLDQLAAMKRKERIESVDIFEGLRHEGGK